MHYHLALVSLFGLSGVLAGPCGPPHYHDGEATVATWHRPSHAHSTTSTLSVKRRSTPLSDWKTPTFHPGHPHPTSSASLSRRTTITSSTGTLTTAWSHPGPGQITSSSTTYTSKIFTSTTKTTTVTPSSSSDMVTTSKTTTSTATTIRPGTTTTTPPSGAIGNGSCDNSLSEHHFYLQLTSSTSPLSASWAVLDSISGLQKMTFVFSQSSAGIFQFVPNVCNLASAGTVAERQVMNTPGGTSQVEPQFNVIREVFASGHAAPECNWEGKERLVCGAEGFYVCGNGLLGLGTAPEGCDVVGLKVVLQ